MHVTSRALINHERAKVEVTFALTTHATHNLVKNEESAILVTDRLHGFKVTLRRWNDTCGCPYYSFRDN